MKRFFTLTLTLSFASKVFGSVGIMVAPPRLGYGDVASNVYMAHLLQTAGVKDISLIFYETMAETIPVLKTLVPQFKGEDYQDIDGILFQNAKSCKNKFDLTLSFASTPTIASIHRSPASKFKVHFFEYSYRRQEQTATFFRSGPEDFGLYLRREFHQPPFSRNEVLKSLQSDIKTSSSEISLAFTYSSERPLTDAYIKAIAKIASKPINANRTYLIASNFPAIELELPKNLVVINPRLSLKMSESIIAHSDFPVVVTGDVSLSMAIEYGKAYLYELKRHKELLISELFQTYRQDARIESSQLEKIQFALNPPIGNLPELTFLKLLQDFLDNPQSKEIFKMANKRLKEKHSLVHLVERLQKIASNLEERPVEHERIRNILTKAYCHGLLGEVTQ